MTLWHGAVELQPSIATYLDIMSCIVNCYFDRLLLFKQQNVMSLKLSISFEPTDSCPTNWIHFRTCPLDSRNLSEAIQTSFFSFVSFMTFNTGNCGVCFKVECTAGVPAKNISNFFPSSSFFPPFFFWHLGTCLGCEWYCYMYLSVQLVCLSLNDIWYNVKCTLIDSNQHYWCASERIHNFF